MRAATWTLALTLLLSAVPASAAPPGPVHTAPLIVLKTKHVAVNVKINDAGPFRLVLDTGSPITFVSGRVADRSGLLPPEAAARPALLGMRGQAVARTLEIGGARVRSLGLMVLDHPVIDALSQIDGPVDGIVGYSFLARFRTTIDYARARVTLVPVDYQPQDVMSSMIARLMSPESVQNVIAPAGLWGMLVEKPDTEEGVVVKRVYPKSAAAAAGLREGDRILTIDGRWMESQTDCWEAAAATPPGSTARLKIRRDGQERELSLKPRIGL